MAESVAQEANDAMAELAQEELLLVAEEANDNVTAESIMEEANDNATAESVVQEASDAMAELVREELLVEEANNGAMAAESVVVEEAKDASVAAARSSRWSMGPNLKKFQVAITGGTVTAVGLVLIPAPVPLGVAVAAYGISILGTEFEGPQLVVDGAKRKLGDSLEGFAEALRGKEKAKREDDDDNNNNDGKRLENQEGSVEAEGSGTKEGERDACVTVTAAPVEINSASSSSPVVVDGNEDETDNRPSQPPMVVPGEKKSFLQGVGKGWRVSTSNVGKGWRVSTSNFITGRILPALRSTHESGEAATATNLSSSIDDVQAGNFTINENNAATTSTTTTALDESLMVPESTASIVSISSMDSSFSYSDEESINATENVVPVPLEC